MPVGWSSGAISFEIASAGAASARTSARCFAAGLEETVSSKNVPAKRVVRIIDRPLVFPGRVAKRSGRCTARGKASIIRAKARCEILPNRKFRRFSTSDIAGRTGPDAWPSKLARYGVPGVSRSSAEQRRNHPVAVL